MSLTRLFLLDEQSLFRQSFAMLMRSSDALELVGESNSVLQTTQLLTQSPVDVLLMSVTLPGKNPFHVARMLRARFPRIQAAFLDNYPIEIHVRQALRSGALGYFTRCDSFATIEQRLHRVARGEQALSPEFSNSVFEDEQSTIPPTTISGSQLGLLTARELEILRHLAEGLSVRQSAEKLSLAQSTVDNHKSRLMRKLNVHKAVDLTRIAIREGLMPA